MPCTNCVSVSQIMDWLRTVDQWCTKKIDRINRILRNFYLSTVWFADNIVAQPITFTWVGTIQTLYPVYKVMGFFGSWCGEQCYIPQNNKCCGEWTKSLKMYQTKLEPQTWQYKMECETEIKAVIPAWFSWYLLYSRWPSAIDNMTSEVCLDGIMLSWLEYYMEMFYEQVEWEVNRMNVSKQRYDEWFELAKESQSNWVFEIVNWEWTMLW